MASTFKGSHLSFSNDGIHFMISEIITFRKQLTKRITQDFKTQSGWDNAMNRFMVTNLEKLADTLENITYTEGSFTQEELEANAANTARSLSDDYEVSSISADNVVMPVGVEREVIWKLDGSDPDIPQLTQENCPNDFARGFVTLLDKVFCELTRLDSRNNYLVITKYESVMMRSLLESLYAITQRKGGEANRMDIPSGTLNKDEPSTFEG